MRLAPRCSYGWDTEDDGVIGYGPHSRGWLRAEPPAWGSTANNATPGGPLWWSRWPGCVA